MKTRRSSPRKRSLREASTPDKTSESNDSTLAIDSKTIQPRSLKRASISPPLPSASASDDDDVEFLHTNPPPQSTETRAVVELPISEYPHTTSAYLQSLAEISHTILWDARWRVGGSKKHRLFAWEQGDDMNALHKLSRRYIQLPKPSHHGSIENSESNSGDCNDDWNNAFEESEQKSVEEEPDDRCLETYSRLYFRKGPWFRLDNIYKSYYMPKMRKSTEPSPEKTDDAPIVPPIKKPASPSKFFRRRNTNDYQNSRKNNRRNNVSEDDYIDHEYVDLQMDAVVLLLEDIKRLFRVGLIRPFHSEEECGKTVGYRQGKFNNTMASLLRIDEQRTVLAKLGGQKKRASNASSTPKSDLEQKEKPLENLIWKQMCQQQTIFNCFTNKRSSTVLPVIKHVHDILLQKWALAIILKASKVEYIPSPILRSATKAVSNALFELTSKSGVASTIMCIRLREAPVQTLRRACRLYLCATSGPGDMRNSGTNAWRSLPESHTKDLRCMPLRTNVVAPPGSSWNTVSYPGKDWRLRVLSCQFMNAFQPMIENDSHHDYGDTAEESVVEKEINVTLVTQTSEVNKRDMSLDQNDAQVFLSVQAFHQWEIGVELRENCDFLLELNELLLYNERKRAKEGKGGHQRDSDSDEDDNDDVNKYTNQLSSEDDDSQMSESEIDFLDLHTIAGRAKIIRGLLALQKNDGKEVVSNIEQDVSTLLGTPFGDRPLSALIASASNESGSSQCTESRPLENECERVLGVIGIMLIHVLEFRNTSIHQTEATRMVKRPWLRHLNWEGCTSYILWDIIPILERRGYYEFAISALEVLLFGRRLRRTTNKIIPDCFAGGPENNKGKFVPSYQPLISRRARGKALDRLIIDHTHFVRKIEKMQAPAQSKSKKKVPMKSSANEVVKLLAEPLIRSSIVSGQISFSSIRTLARRLKRPLSHTLEGLESYEARELGHRLSNADDMEQDMTKYNDWTPFTDSAVANSMTYNSDSAGGRCSFVGFEEDDHAVRMGSLNVEELAKEYYHQGRLPAIDESPTKGGWTGYHDEGGKIRILFRILSSSVLGMDWNSTANSLLSTSEASTIHLTPYQGAPFDLHVGAEQVDYLEVGCRGIYVRRKIAINNFLENLSSLEGEDLSDFVYDCINNRVQYTNSLNRPDLSLESDLQKVRTLSMLAVGFGGKMLASIFRCFFFDYRHYSGGLPDLLLVRALYTPTFGDRTAEELVDLGEWIGEDFSSEHQEAIKANQIARIFMDTDGDFLGCSKVGDSGGRVTNRFQRPGRIRNNTNAGKEEDSSNEKSSKTPYKMPEKLSLSHCSRQIRVECMFVEVKSQNDRLDSRQEDWLNILDLYGNARVCKFEKTPKREKGAS